jgi:hypothetical protein
MHIEKPEDPCAARKKPTLGSEGGFESARNFLNQPESASGSGLGFGGFFFLGDSVGADQGNVNQMLGDKPDL